MTVLFIMMSVLLCIYLLGVRIASDMIADLFERKVAVIDPLMSLYSWCIALILYSTFYRE